MRVSLIMVGGFIPKVVGLEKGGNIRTGSRHQQYMRRVYKNICFNRLINMDIFAII